MAVSKSLFVLVMIFGSSSWLGTNSVWMELPLLTAKLPEGWGLPSYLAAVVQIACISPLIYTILHKGCNKRFTLPTVPLIVGFLTLAIICSFGLVFFWDTTITLSGKEYSAQLYLLMFGIALMNSISNVLFMPFMAQFHPAYLTAYFVGMGFSSLIPSMLSLAQGTGSFDCIPNNATMRMDPLFIQPRFSASVFFSFTTLWTMIALGAFLTLYMIGVQNKAGIEEANEDTPLTNKDSDNKDSSIVSTRRAESTEKQALNSPIRAEAGESPEPKSKSVSAQSKVSTAEEKDKEDPEVASYTKGWKYAFILIATALVNAQMNGVIPSTQSYAALPYSQAIYHYGLAIAHIVSPACSFLPFFFTLRSLPVLAALTAMASILSGCILYLASLSPNMLFDSVMYGGAVSMLVVITAAGLDAYLRIVFASLLREGTQSEARLFWCGLFIQVGSFIGSAVMFPLISVVHVFKSAYPCQNIPYSAE